MNETRTAAPQSRQILFVCSGNICRSPMAHVFAQSILKQSPTANVLVQSAGTLKISGSPASKEAVQVMAELGHDLSQHRSQGIAPILLKSSDWIVVMEPEHEEAVLNYLPAASDKVVRLWEYSDKCRAWGFIPDPIGRPLDVYRFCRDSIQEGLLTWFRAANLAVEK